MSNEQSNNQVLDPIEKLVNLHDELEELTQDLRAQIKQITQQKESKDYRRLLYEKELSQLLSGYAQLQRIRLDILKELKKEVEEQAYDETMLMKLLEGNIQFEDIEESMLQQKDSKTDA